jgi:acyl phosphate:glycerol-3-phosphate acyltransferase
MRLGLLSMPSALSPELALAATLAGAYALGGLSPGWWLVRRFGGGDIRAHGSGKTGATNARRVLGERGFAAVLLLDAVKGAAAVLAARWLEPSQPWAALALPAVVAGHIWPVWLGFRGGRGGGPLLGGCFALSWQLAAASIAAGLLVGGLARRRFLAGVTAVAFSLAAVWWLIPGGPARVSFVAAAALVVLAHRSYLGKPLKL